MTLLEKIKIKTQQTNLKADEFLRENGVIAGMAVSAAAVFAGLTGIAAIATVAVPGAIVAAPIATVASLASGAGVSILGTSINMAGASMMIGGWSGIGFAAFSKIYKNIRNADAYYDSLGGSHDVKCVNHAGTTVKVPALKFYEMVAEGTLKDSFKEIVVATRNDKGANEEKRYSTDLTLEQASFVQGETNIEKISRLLFKNTKNMSLASKMADKIKTIRGIYSEKEIKGMAIQKR